MSRPTRWGNSQVLTAVHEWGDQLPVLEGERVALRPLRRSDVPSLFAIFGDPAVMRYWSSPPLADLDEASMLLDELEQFFHRRELFQWGVALRDDDAVIGTCTLFHLDTAHRRAEVGFAMRSDVWGRGLASEALELLIRFSFETLALHRLEADADPENVRSLRILERHGFKREGYLRERWHHLGEIRDAVFLGLLRNEWLSE